MNVFTDTILEFEYKGKRAVIWLADDGFWMADL